MPATSTFAPEHDSVPAARRFLRRTLDEWQAADWEWAASQVLTELTTNAVIHAHTPFVVELSLDDDVLKICVSDGSMRLPSQRAYSPTATTGRGISVVESLTQSWGVETRSDGKTVWCALLADAGLSAVDPDLDVWLKADDTLGHAANVGRAALGGACSIAA